jgi:tetratricopeptide (TPR) repeat protein
MSSKRSWQIWTSVLLFLMLSFGGHGQGVESAMRFADKQQRLGNFEIALKEYQRAWIFNDDNDRNTELFRNIAYTFEKSGDLERAYNYAELAYKSTNDAAERADLMFWCARYQLAAQAYYETIRLMLGCEAYDQESEKLKNFYIAVAYFELSKFQSSKKYFCRVIQDTSFVETCLSDRKLHRPKPKTARIMSSILPGSGQVYAGNLGSALNSLVLTGSIAMIGINMYFEYSLVSALLAAGPYYQRYYMGGVKNAEHLAVSKQRDNRLEVLQRLIDKIQEEGQGLGG